MAIYTTNNKIWKLDNKWVNKPDVVPPEPVPANTIRVKFASGYTPTMGDTQTLVDSTNNIWDIHKERTFSTLFYDNTNLLEVIDANSSNITSTAYMFNGCSSLTTVHLFDTSNVTTMQSMFQGCSSLTTVPLFNTSNVDSIDAMLWNCVNVESGALALYQQASTQTNPPIQHTYTFRNCGSNTVTGAAELAQIPSNWK